MIIAIGLIAAAATVFAYSYWNPRKDSGSPEAQSLSDSSASQSAPTKSAPGARGNVYAHDPSIVTDGGECETLQSAVPIPQQKSQNEKAVIPPRAPQNGFLKPTPSPPDLMLPPARPNPSIPKPSTGLRPPPSAASSLRAPPTHTSRPNSAFAPSASTLPPQSRPLRKVLLAPGHSPLDWAALTRSPPSSTYLRGSDVPPNRLIRVTPSMLKAHNGRKGTYPWGVFGGRVYNLKPYADFHPGGVPELMKAAGNEKGDALFREVHPWVSWENMLGECCVGILVSEEEGRKEEARMEEMD